MRAPSICLVLLLAAAGAASAAHPAPVDTAEPSSAALFAPLGRTSADIRTTLELPAATWINDHDGDKVFDSLETRFMDGETQPVIVTFVDGADFDSALSASEEALRGPARMAFPNVGGLYAHADLDAVHALALLDVVRQVEWSQPGSSELDLATMDMGVDAVQDALVLPDRVGLDGSGVAIGIMDTGIDGKHVDLADRISRFVDWSADGAEVEAYDAGSHGTHVAGIAAGTGAGDEKYKGVAPGASIVGFRITPDCSAGTTLVIISTPGSCNGDTKANAIASIDYMIGHKDELGVRISTISFGFGTTRDGTDALELAMDRAFEAGILPFKSTGNSGPEQGTVTIPGGARGIVSIGSMYAAQDGGFRLSSFSSRGPTEDGRIKPDLVAPGNSISAPRAGSTDGYVSLSGTSMASPFAAGVAALVLEADPTLGPEELREILFQTSHDWGPAEADVDYGNGRLDALRAVQEALARRAVREGSAAFADALRLAGPDAGDHAFAVLSSQAPEHVFEVMEADVPVGITVLHNGTGLPLRIALVRVLGPGGEDLGGTPLPSQSRQITFSFTPQETGKHTVVLVTEALNEEVLVDVHAGLGLEVPLLQVPDEVVALQETGSKDVPTMALLLPLLGLAALALRRR